MHKGQGADIFIMALEGLYSPEYTLANLNAMWGTLLHTVFQSCVCSEPKLT